MDPHVFFALEMFGTVVFAISGAMSAGRERFDLGGVILGAGGVGLRLAAMAGGLLLPAFRGKQPDWPGGAGQ